MSTAKRIALLGPRDERDPRAAQVRWLHGGLTERGLEVASFAISDSPTAEALDLVPVLDRAAEIDLIHNHVSPRAVAYGALVGTPVLTTLYAAGSEEEMTLYRKLASGWIASAIDGLEPDGLPIVATISPATGDENVGRLVADYVAVYDSILEKTQRHRVDKLHDARPWGEYRVLEDREDYKVKRIDVLPGKRLSYQRHERRSEHWIIVRGRARVTLDGKELIRGLGETVDIPAHAAHRIESIGDDVLTFVEIQQGDYFGEDDIERLEDDFGRAGTKD